METNPDRVRALARDRGRKFQAGLPAEIKKERAARSNLARALTRLGLTREAYDAMLAAQNGACAICGAASGNDRGYRLHIDHDHETGKVRALLCHGCNTGIGGFSDNPELLRAAADYLDRHRGPG
jgi:hypothetical protein